jgi:hypothetical protein
MWWQQLLGVGVFVLAHKTLPFDEHPQRPWQDIGSAPYLWVQNESDTAQAFAFAAPQVDSVVRIQVVPAHSDALLRSPYADTRVTVVSGRDTMTFTMDRPGFYPFTRKQ